MHTSEKNSVAICDGLTPKMAQIDWTILSVSGPNMGSVKLKALPTILGMTEIV